MTKKIILLLLFCNSFFCINAQETIENTVFTDSLSEVVVKSFHFNGNWLKAPVSVSLISSKQLQIKAMPSLLPALNAIAGVRMEERSPLSYRLSIRGSVLRSPFGVRNIKMYWNNIPISDGSGNTYFNLIDATQISEMEVAKGTAASMYGAGTSGVVLLETSTKDTSKNAFNAQLSVGNFNSIQQQLTWKYQSNKSSGSFTQSHQQSSGYRHHAASQKNNFTWINDYTYQKHQIQSLVWYTHLYYQTPGALTEAQWLQNPKASRFATNTLPSAATQKAAIYNNTLFAGVHHQYKFSRNHQSSIAVVVNNSNINNPFITNYETRNEWNVGIHAKSIVQKNLKSVQFEWINGFEYLHNFSNIANYGNKLGEKDTLQLRDKVQAIQSFLYTQLQFKFNRFQLVFGTSLNQQNILYKRVSDGVQSFTHKKTPIHLMPRLSVLFPIQSSSIAVYSSVAKGFSPPSLAEVRPSDGNFYNQLRAENGWNVEFGVKGFLFNNQVQFDVNFYHFLLKDAIVRRNSTTGTEFFINAGSIQQKGIELFAKWNMLKQSTAFLKQISISNASSYQPYLFRNYQQAAVVYDGKKVTGVAPINYVNTVLIELNNGLYTEISHQYTDKIPLNDANDSFANDYHLLQIRIGYLFKNKKKQYHFFVGVDNLLNEKYSLGNDINAIGRRYFNAAPTINFFGGIKMAW